MPLNSQNNPYPLNSDPLQLYVFSSESQTNIWAGVSSKMWAIQQCNIKNIIQKMNNIPIGSLGLFYCSETQTFTTPFIIKSKPKNKLISTIWADVWQYPFEIIPLGDPSKNLSKDILRDLLPSVKNSNKSWNHVLHIAPQLAFCSSNITKLDWSIIIDKLSY